ncbi:hypothetical protein J001_00385 [Cryptococcus neoformans]|nr:hypothetical protein J001_00385 [Cryptococcus neoformans var. grubii]
MPPRRYALDTSAQAPTASQYSKTLQSKTPAKRPFQQASNTTNCGTGEAVGHDKCIGREGLVRMLSFLSNQSQMRKAIQYQATMDLYISLRSLLQAK